VVRFHSTLVFSTTPRARVFGFCLFRWHALFSIPQWESPCDCDAFSLYFFLYSEIVVGSVRVCVKISEKEDYYEDLTVFWVGLADGIFSSLLFRPRLARG
jgi:hypothetical protein